VTHTAGSSTYRIAWAAGTVTAFAFPEILSSAGGARSFGGIATSGDGSGWMTYTPGCECLHIVYLVPFLDDANPGAGPPPRLPGQPR
jgi:hypothetical protein